MLTAILLMLAVIPSHAEDLNLCSPKPSSPTFETGACGNPIVRASWKTKTMIAQNQPSLFELSPAFKKSLAPYDEAIRQNPDDAFAYYDRAAIYHNFGEIDRAIADYSQVIRLLPDEADAYFDRGNAYFQEEKFGRAIADYGQVIRLAPDNAGAIFKRALAVPRRATVRSGHCRLWRSDPAAPGRRRCLYESGQCIS